jgi:NAD(P)-dependent dehydrogenase (short-subunit alcohol dehydrogenase family)
MDDRNVVLITGASTGIGKACAEYLGGMGYRVYGTSRRATARPKRAGSFTMIRMEITNTDSVNRGVDLIIAREGRLDVVVNNAGAGIVGPVEEIPIEDAETNVRTNCLGALRVCKAVIPHMRRQGGGHIINMSSQGGVLGLPYQAIYSAGKFALEGLSEALRIELRRFMIRVSVIEPGDIRTQDCRSAISRAPAYEPFYSQACAIIEANEKKGYPPERIGPLVQRIIQSRNPRLRYTFGQAFQSAVPILKRIVPQRFAQWVLALYYKC